MDVPDECVRALDEARAEIARLREELAEQAARHAYYCAGKPPGMPYFFNLPAAEQEQRVAWQRGRP